MKKIVFPASCLTVVCLLGAALAALPIRQPELIDAVVAKVVAATEAEKRDGVVAIVFLKDRKKRVPITKDTDIHRQMGKLVPFAEVRDVKVGAKVSIWLNPKGVAEGVLIFP